MAPRKNPDNSVPAKVVDLAPNLDPVPAAIVADRRNLLGPRLALLGLVLLLLFFAIGGYVQAARNEHKLNQAIAERSLLIKSLADLARTNRAQTDLIKQLQDAIRAQNKLLKSAGYNVVVIPGNSTVTTERNEPSPKPQQSPAPQSSPSHSSKPTPKPTPSPNPTNSVGKTICELTGICVSHLFFIF